MSRLDRLGPAREILQIGAVIGSEFSYELLRAVHPLAEEALQRGLFTLSDSDLLYVRGVAPHATYVFKHALIRDAAYEALLKSRRRELHRQVARTINEKFPSLKDAHPAVIARHWTEAGEIEPAIAEWSRAGRASEADNAFKEAEESYQGALAVLKQLPESSERDLRELELRQAVVRILFATRGHADPQTIRAAESAVGLAEKSGRVRPVLNLIIAQGISAVVSGDVKGGRALADRALELAIREDSPSVLGRVRLLHTMAHFYGGDLAGAEKQFTRGLEFFEQPGLRRIPGVVTAAFAYGSLTAWTLGRAEIARDRMSRMLGLADENNPFELAFSGNFASELLVSMREYEEAESSAVRTLQIAEKHNFPEIIAGSRYYLGSARSQREPAEGVALIRQGLAMLETRPGHDRTATRMECQRLVAKTFLAEALHRGGSIDDALETIEQVLQAALEVPLYRPEVLRRRGELLYAKGRTDLASADFDTAIALARSMEAKPLELRATMSLARLLPSRGRGKRARAMLAQIYGWFTEGFDTADLKDAKSLLDELSE
jgi:tetratricopeptide (TPR) repeat protein